MIDYFSSKKLNSFRELMFIFHGKGKPGLCIQLQELTYFVRIHSEDGDSGASGYYGSSRNPQSTPLYKSLSVDI